jgi:hypothetical protein
MKFPELNIMVEEHLTEKYADYTQETFDAYVAGMTWAINTIKSLALLAEKKAKLIKEERNV